MKKTPGIFLSLNRRRLIVTVVLLTLIVTVGQQQISLVDANPAPLFSFPTKAIMTPPILQVTSLTHNQTLNSNSVWITFTVTKPKEWFAFNAGKHMDGSPINQAFVNITSLYYILDNNERQNISFHDIDNLFNNPSPNLALQLSKKLSLSNGPHSIKIGIEADSYYVVRYTYNFSDALSSTKLQAESEPVNFAVITWLEPPLVSFASTTPNNSDSINAPNELPPTLMILPIAIFVLGILAYFRKSIRRSRS